MSEQPITPQMLVHAAELIIGTQFGSGSMLQRRLQIGRQRADDVLDQLEKYGVVGPAAPDSYRSVLVKSDDIDTVAGRIYSEGVKP